MKFSDNLRISLIMKGSICIFFLVINVTDCLKVVYGPPDLQMHKRRCGSVRVEAPRIYESRNANRVVNEDRCIDIVVDLIP